MVTIQRVAVALSTFCAGEAQKPIAPVSDKSDSTALIAKADPGAHNPFWAANLPKGFGAASPAPFVSDKPTLDGKTGHEKDANYAWVINVQRFRVGVSELEKAQDSVLGLEKKIGETIGLERKETEDMLLKAKKILNERNKELVEILSEMGPRALEGAFRVIQEKVGSLREEGSKYTKRLAEIERERPLATPEGVRELTSELKRVADWLNLLHQRVVLFGAVIDQIQSSLGDAPSKQIQQFEEGVLKLMKKQDAIILLESKIEKAEKPEERKLLLIELTGEKAEYSKSQEELLKRIDAMTPVVKEGVIKWVAKEQKEVEEVRESLVTRIKMLSDAERGGRTVPKSDELKEIEGIQTEQKRLQSRIRLAGAILNSVTPKKTH